MPFIVFEGIAGSGKTTQKKLLASYLRKKGNKVLITEEPSNYRIGRLVKKYIKRKELDYVDFFLFIADRLEHLQREIIPYLKKNFFVICERFTLSTFAYQKFAGINEKLLLDTYKFINEKFPIGKKVTFLLDLPADTAIKRFIKPEKYYEKKEVIEKVRKNYLYYYRKLKSKEKIYLIDASVSIKEVFNQIVRIIEKKFKV